MTDRIVFRPKARLDLKEIYRHIAEYNPPAAAGVILGVHAKIQSLLTAPGMGQGVPHLATGLRRFPCGSYLIFYRPLAQGIDVVRILHGARDTDSLLRADLL